MDEASLARRLFLRSAPGRGRGCPGRPAPAATVTLLPAGCPGALCRARPWGLGLATHPSPPPPRRCLLPLPLPVARCP
jgi:hypothetical protein